jgi:hypothetical protein
MTAANGGTAVVASQIMPVKADSCCNATDVRPYEDVRHVVASTRDTSEQDDAGIAPVNCLPIIAP